MAATWCCQPCWTAAGDEIDLEAHEGFSDSLEDSGMDDSQIDAVAMCLAAERFHLVQGPPGTGKTYALAGLVKKLVEQGQRVLANRIHPSRHPSCAAENRGRWWIARYSRCPIRFPTMRRASSSRTPSPTPACWIIAGPYVIGATPFALFSTRAGEARFDVAVIDETSQMRVEAAIMPMLRAQRWFFFGDRQQLPPVVQRPVADAAEDSVFARLSRKRQPHDVENDLSAERTAHPLAVGEFLSG